MKRLLYRHKLLAGLGLVLFQLAYALVVSPGPGEPAYNPSHLPSGWTTRLDRYSRLNNWDSFHYYEVAERGYHLPPGGKFNYFDVHEFRATGAYLPVYPILARMVHRALRIPTEISLILVAELAALVFWYFFFLLLEHWKVKPQHAALLALLIWIHPGSFFMVAGYTESLFAALMTAFIYYCEKKKTLPSIVAGMLLCATRINGVLLMAYPVLRAWSETRPRWSLAPFTIAVCGAASFFLFLAYCALVLGVPDLYFKIQGVGWAHSPNYLAMLSPLTYIPGFFKDADITVYNQIAATLGTALTIGLFLLDSKAGRRVRLGFYSAAFAMLFIAISAKANTKMDGVLRYTQPVFILLALSAANASVVAKSPGFQRLVRSRVFLGTVAALAVLSLVVQGIVAHRFTHGKWIT